MIKTFKQSLGTGLIVSSLFISAPALAWENLSEGNNCQIGQSFDGPGNTILIISQSQDGFDDGDWVMLYLQNKNWSINSGEQLGVIRIENDDGEWVENNAYGGNHSFGLRIPFNEFERIYSGENDSIMVFREGQLIDKLSLSGFSLYYNLFFVCRYKKITAKAEQERLDNIEKNIPRDPFAK